LLCYRCGSYTPDGSRKCAVCSEPFAAHKRRSVLSTARANLAGALRPPFAPGETAFSRFQILGAAEHGVTGWVLQARDLMNGEEVALKLISPTLVHTEDEKAKFYSAIKQAASLRHANLVPVLGAAEQGGQLYYFSPYTQGLTLRKIIDLRLEKGETFTLREVLPVFSQLAVAMDFLGRVIVHGALRPGNVIVLPDLLRITGCPHLSGLPRRPLIMLLDERGETDYLAPEARRADLKLRPTADVYSLAVIAGEMLSGARYGREPKRWEELKRALPARVLSALEQGWAEAPAERFTTARAFHNALSAAGADGQGIKVPVPMALEVENTAVEPQALKARSLHDDVESSEPVLLTQPARQGPDESPVDLDTPFALSRPGGERRIRTERVQRPLQVGTTRFRRTASLAAAIVVAGVAISAALIWRNRPALRPIPPAPAAKPPESGETVPPALASKEPEQPGTTESPAPSVATRALPTGVSRLLGRSRHNLTVAQGGRVPREKGHKDSEPMDKTIAVAAEHPAIAAALALPPAPASASAPSPAPAPSLAPAPSPTPMLSPTPALERANSSAQVEASYATGECPSGMIFVPGGSFEMGSSGDDPLAGFGELVATAARVASFCIDTYEFPNEVGTLPLVSVTWEMAKGFCEKRGRRLCTEAEWERACKGPVNARFPFGNGSNDSICNLSRPGHASVRRPSGSFPGCKSDFGVLDLAGNVAEWTSTPWSSDVPNKVVKGGAADQALTAGRCAARANEPAQSRQSNLGFRCCREAH
jgi:formylglycine-generating enzyme required for sulfatase activity/serine/threonine protein kinase